MSKEISTNPRKGNYLFSPHSGIEDKTILRMYMRMI